MASLLSSGFRHLSGRSLHVALLVLLSVLPSCTGSDPSISGDFEAETVDLEYSGTAAYIPELEGPLRIMSATPNGTMLGMTPDQAIAATFSKPMVPLGEEPEVPDETIRINPDVKGTVHWDGTQILVFQPDKPLPPATSFRVTVAAGLKAVDGEALEKPFTWTFETPRPAVVSSQPANDELYVDPRQAIVLRFNQAVSADAVSRFMALTANNTTSRTPFSIKAEGDSTLVLRPSRLLAQGTRYRLAFLPGLPGVRGNLGMADTSSIRFTVYDKLKLREISQYKSYWEEDLEGFNPERGITLEFTTPVRFSDLRRALTFTPAVEWPAGIEAQDDVVSASHTIDIDWDPETTYRLTVRNLQDQFKQVLPEASNSFTTRAYDPSIRMQSGLLIVEAGEQHTLPIRATNVASVRLGMERIRPDQVIPSLQAYDQEHYYGEQSVTGKRTVMENLHTVPLKLKRNKPGIVRIRLDSLLVKNYGVVGVRLVTPEFPGQETPSDVRALAQVTNLGITAKFSAHQNLIFVTDLRTARPVAGADVTIRDANNRVRWKGKTNGSGRVATPGWSVLRIPQPNQWDHPIQFVFVEKGGDFSFTSSVYRDGLEPYRFDVDYQWWPEPVAETGSIFTDRGLYRTGETVNLKGIIRRKSDAEWKVISGPVRILVSSPRDKVVLDRVVTSSAFGTFDLAWDVPPGADQGAYSVRVVHANDTTALKREYYDRGDIARGEFRVDAFRTSTFAVTAHAMADDYVVGDFFEGTINGRYLFGAAMGGQPVRYSLEKRPGYFSPPGFDSYQFGSYTNEYDEWYYETMIEADTLLREDGMVGSRIQLTGNTSGAPSTLIWQGSVTDPARQEMTDRTEITLHPALFYVGLKPYSTFLDLSEDKEMYVDVVTIDPAGRPVAGQVVDVELIRQQWNSVREVGSDGRLNWKSEPTEEHVGRQRVRSQPGKAIRITMPIKEGGSYVLRATGHDVRGNVVRSESFFYATGGGYVAWERNDDDRIEVVPEQTSYKPGETARIMVQSPYESAMALITLEREGVISSRVTTLKGSAPQIEIPLTEAHMPNVFVSVVLLNGRTARPGPGSDVGAPSFKIGYAALEVDPGVRHLAVDVKPNKTEYRPGDDVTVELNVRNAAGKGVAGEITFSAADAGVLNLIGYALPDPFDTFYGSRPLGVSTSETLANLLEQRNFGQKEQDMIGGGGDADYLLRKDFRALAHWAPAVRTDNRGHAVVRFKLPQSLTTFRLMATAQTPDNRFGKGQTDVTVTQPLVMQPALPRFTRPADRFEAGVLVTNLTGKVGQAVVAARAAGLQLIGANRKAVTLKAGETREIRFAWATPSSGPVKVQFNAQLGSERDALEVSLPVTLPTIRQTDATFASTESSVSEKLALPAQRVKGVGRFEIRLSSTALVGLDGAARYLFEYPYGCLEQRTSRIRPLLLANDLIQNFDLKVLQADRKQLIDQWLQDLDDYWVGDGFSMWPGIRSYNPYVSAYVVLALAEARAAGFTVPDEMTRQAVDQLAGHVRNRSDRPAYYSEPVWDDTRAFMLYALARHKVFLESEISTLADRAVTAPSSISIDGISYLIRTIELSKKAELQPYENRLVERLKSLVRVEATTAYITSPGGGEYEWIFASDTRSTAYGVTALIEAGPSPDFRPIAQKMIQYLMQARASGHWATTQENAAVIDAFRTYYAAFETTVPRFTAEVRVAGQSILKESFSGRSLKVAQTTRTPDALASRGPAAVTISRSGQGTLYYSMLLETFTNAPQVAATNGITIQREIQRLNRQGIPTGAPLVTGSRTITLLPGELVRVTIRITSPTERNYVVVDDALPAGLEGLNAAFETTNQEVLENADAGQSQWWGSFNHTEIRDDRVLLFADYLHRGEHKYTYVARATTPGTFVHPPAQAEMMYRPEVFGRTATGSLVVSAPGTAIARK